MSEFSVVVYDFPGLLADLVPGTRRDAWHEDTGPDSGCGLDFWYRHWRSGLVYINVDQESVKIIASNSPVDDADEVLYEGCLEDDPKYGKFARTQHAPKYGKFTRTQHAKKSIRPKNSQKK